MWLFDLIPYHLWKTMGLSYSWFPTELSSFEFSEGGLMCRLESFRTKDVLIGSTQLSSFVLQFHQLNTHTPSSRTMKPNPQLNFFPISLPDPVSTTNNDNSITNSKSIELLTPSKNHKWMKQTAFSLTNTTNLVHTHISHQALKAKFNNNQHKKKIQ